MDPNSPGFTGARLRLHIRRKYRSSGLYLGMMEPLIIPRKGRDLANLNPVTGARSDSVSTDPENTFDVYMGPAIEDSISKEFCR